MVSLALGLKWQILDDLTDLGDRYDTEFRCCRYLSWKCVDACGMVRRWSTNHARVPKAPLFLVGKRSINETPDFGLDTRVEYPCSSQIHRGVVQVK